MEKTRAFIGPRESARVIVKRHTTFGLGGLTIDVTGTGRVALHKEAFGEHEQELRYVVELDPAAVARVFGAIVEENFVELVVPKQPGVPDELYVTIALIAAGGTHWIGKFDSCESAAFERLVDGVRAEVGAVVDAATRERLTL